MANSPVAVILASLAVAPLANKLASFLSIKSAVRYKAVSMAKVLVAMSPIFAWITPNSAMDLPNCFRVLAYSAARLTAKIAPPTPPAPALMRPPFKWSKPF